MEKAKREAGFYDTPTVPALPFIPNLAGMSPYPPGAIWRPDQAFHRAQLGQHRAAARGADGQVYEPTCRLSRGDQPSEKGSIS